MFETSDTSLRENAALENDPVALERAAQRAALDLQRIIVLLLQRNVSARRSAPWRPAPALTWRTLLDIEEQAFADLGFQGRHPAAVRASFSRLADTRITGGELDAQVDWQRDEEPLPAVYAIARGFVSHSQMDREDT
ncbi:DUF2471 family protein [Paraburkholderia sp. Ac-20347]|uniref:DUF2471 family protein n=1 Tax=Paraburkholderia sp. Ac-20347 TaxID=2703892 RepID=UPI00197EE03F|nr:DUF2471 family protein [Paraburkholderia sp. Ac-20347]MBN3808529.1 DUF2471 family protein [Paraburkholderia sp. Ac-20347]